MKLKYVASYTSCKFQPSQIELTYAANSGSLSELDSECFWTTHVHKSAFI